MSTHSPSARAPGRTLSVRRAAPLAVTLIACVLAGCAATGGAALQTGSTATAATGVGKRADPRGARERLRALRSPSSTDFLNDD